MQKPLPNEPTSYEQEVVLRLESGDKLILNIAPLATLFDHFEITNPKDFSTRIQDLMDRFVETIEIQQSGFELHLFKDDYELLRAFREVFKKMAGKEVCDGSGGKNLD